MTTSMLNVHIFVTKHNGAYSLISYKEKGRGGTLWCVLSSQLYALPFFSV
ncbi:hypothetical protein STFR1_40274 [Bacillus vallismortis]